MNLKAGQPGHRRFTNSIRIAIATVGMVIASGFAAFILYYFHLVDFLTLFVNGIIRVMAAVFYFAVIFVYIRYVLSLNYEYSVFFGVDEPAPPRHAAGATLEFEPPAQPEPDKRRRARHEKTPEAPEGGDTVELEQPRISLAQPFAPPPEEPAKKRGPLARREKEPEPVTPGEPVIPDEPAEVAPEQPKKKRGLFSRREKEPEPVIPEEPAPREPEEDGGEVQKPPDSLFDIHIDDYNI